MLKIILSFITKKIDICIFFSSVIFQLKKMNWRTLQTFFCHPWEIFTLLWLQCFRSKLEITWILNQDGQTLYPPSSFPGNSNNGNLSLDGIGEVYCPGQIGSQPESLRHGLEKGWFPSLLGSQTNAGLVLKSRHFPHRSGPQIPSHHSWVVRGQYTAVFRTKRCWALRNCRVFTVVPP